MGASYDFSLKQATWLYKVSAHLVKGVRDRIHRQRAAEPLALENGERDDYLAKLVVFDQFDRLFWSLQAHGCLTGNVQSYRWKKDLREALNIDPTWAMADEDLDEALALLLKDFSYDPPNVGNKEK